MNLPGKTNLLVILLIAITAFISCRENYTPKPRGYFRISFPVIMPTNLSSCTTGIPLILCSLSRRAACLTGSLGLQNITFFVMMSLIFIIITPYGKSAGIRSPAVSFNLNIRFMFCIACPEAPLTRLSMADTTTSRPL